MQKTAESNNLVALPTTLRAYLLLELNDESPESLQHEIRALPGVVAADVIDGPPDMVAIVEASTQSELVRRTIALASVADDHIVAIRCLPVSDAR